ncbi:hypothetical protein QYF36_016846 [Acer negundo]|nr:hypothetical protein QYF36_016846 [Acer negundo]
MIQSKYLTFGKKRYENQNPNFLLSGIFDSSGAAETAIVTAGASCRLLVLCLTAHVGCVRIWATVKELQVPLSC